jgi:hypothetical protein
MAAPLQTPAWTLVAWAAPLWLGGLCPCGLGCSHADAGLCPCGCAWQITWAAELFPCRLWLCPRGLGYNPHDLVCALADTSLRPHDFGCALVA